MEHFIKVKRAAPLKNVAAFTSLMPRLVERSPELPGLACFYGPSGVGKTKSAVYGANSYRAAYVECGQFTTAKSLLVSICKELGIAQPRGTITDLIEHAVMIMAGDIRRPVIVDEAHHVAHKRFVDVLRELHDKSMAPVILIGEETLPKQLEAFERVHNRMLDWVAAEPCDAEDFRLLVRVSCPDLSIGEDLAVAMLEATGGNTRRLAVNLAKAEEVATRDGLEAIGLAEFGGAAALIGSRAPTPRYRTFKNGRAGR